jgi:cell division protein FtsB
MQPTAVPIRAPRRVQAIRKIAVLVIAVLAVVGIASLLLSGRATSELQLSRKRVEALRSDIAHLQKENARLRAEIDSVKKSTYAVERIAREDLGMSRKGEVIYMLPR